MDKETLRAAFSTLPLSNDFMFGEVMRQIKISTMFLESLLKRKIARIEYVVKQQDISDTLGSHGIRLDVYLEGDDRTVYNIEMESFRRLYTSRRERFYQSVIDRHNLDRGDHYSLLPESYIIFICNFDPFERGLAVYERKLVMKGYRDGDIKIEDMEFDNGSHFYMLNSAFTIENADEPILEFLRCVHNNDTNPANYHSALMKAVCPAIEEIRHDREKEEAYMTLQMKLDDVRMEALMEGREEGRAEGREEGRAEGRAEGREKGRAEGREEDFKMVLSGMYEENLPVSIMARVTKRSEQEVIRGLTALGLSTPQ